MKILVDARTIQDHFPGIGRYVYNLLDALGPLAPGNIQVLTSTAQTNKRYDLTRLQQHANLELIPTDIPVFGRSVQTQLPRVIRKLAPDVVHTPYYVRPLFLRIPSVLTIYDAIPQLYPQYFGRSRRLTIESMKRLAVRTSDAYVAISHATAHDFQRYYGIDPTQIVTAPLAADPIFRTYPAQEIDAFKRRSQLPERYVLYLGSNKPHKNLQTLVRAWGQARQQLDPDIKLIIAGVWDERYPEARDEMMSLQLQASIHFLGPVPGPDLPLLYGGATLFVFPSRYEGFGLPVLEAAACDTPIVCSAIPSVQEIVEKDTLTFDPESPEALAHTILQALLDPEQYDRMKAACGRIQARFNWKNTAACTLQAYELAMKKN